MRRPEIPWRNAWNNRRAAYLGTESPISSPDCAGKIISYLGRYTHRVAISNDRILSLKDGKVTFCWRDYVNRNQVKLMTLDAEEFIRRFLLHILSPGFRKIRHYGLFASRDKGKRLALCRRLTNSPLPAPMSPVAALLERIFGKEFNLCPHCKAGHFAREPPLWNEYYSCDKTQE